MSDMRVPNSIDPAESALSFFASELRRLREAAGLSQAELAAQIHFTRSLVSLTELALRRPSEEFAKLADEALNSDGCLSRLWPLVNRSAYPSWFRSYVDLEGSATAIRSYQPQVVDGLFQTEEYARAVLATEPAEIHRDLDDLVAARIDRRRIFERDEPPYMTLLLDEAVLLHPVGGPDVMRRQFEYLIEASRRPRTVLLVLPVSGRAHANLDGSLQILSFSEGPNVVYSEGYGEGELIGTVATVQRCEVSYHRACADALSPEASRDLIASLLEGPSPWDTGYRT